MPPVETLERHPHSEHHHRRQVFWQIVFPIVIAAFLVLALLVWITNQGRDELRQGADIAAIFLIIPLGAMAFLTFATLLGMAYGLIRLAQVLPYWFSRLYRLIQALKDNVVRMDDRLAEPFLRWQSGKGALQVIMRKVRPGRPSTETVARRPK